MIYFYPTFSIQPMVINATSMYIQMQFPEGIDKSSEAYKKFEGQVIQRLNQTTSAMYSSSRLWDDGILLPQQTRQVPSDFIPIYLKEF